MRHAHRLAGIADEQLAALPYRSLVNAQQAQLAHVRIDCDLEHVRNHMFVRIWRDLHSLHAVAQGPFQKRGRVALRRVRHEPLEDGQQLRDPDSRLGRDKAHRYEMTLAQRLLKRVVKLLRGHFRALLEVQRHQALVQLDHLVDDLGVCALRS